MAQIGATQSNVITHYDYQEEIAPGLVGTSAAVGVPASRFSVICHDQSIRPGTLLQVHTSPVVNTYPGQLLQVEPYATGGRIVGIAARGDFYAEHYDANGNFAVEQGRAFTAFGSGAIFVYSETANATGDPAFIRIAGGTPDQIAYNFRNDNDGGNAEAILTSNFVYPNQVDSVAVLSLSTLIIK